MTQPRTVIIGGGPAGLTAAYELSKRGLAAVVVEAHPDLWGGISRSEEYLGFRFDIGGHRFFSKSAEIEALWDEILPEPLLERPRKSRILYRKRFYSYPLRAGEALQNLGPMEAAYCVASYLRAKVRPVVPVRSFEDWVINAFGRRLYEIFFKTYTEKVWGMPCTAISADWAAQRIKGLSLTTAVANALMPAWAVRGRGVAKSLIASFRYPRLGPGMMWAAAAEKIQAKGGVLAPGQTVREVWQREDLTWEVHTDSVEGTKVHAGTNVVSSMALRDLVRCLRPIPPDEVRSAAERLRYRDFLTVALIVPERNRFDDNWIYIHEPDVLVGRIQNFKSWSPDLVPDPSLACLGMEYFCHQGDGLWAARDSELIDLGARELRQLGLLETGEPVDGTVVRQGLAYPVYDDEYERNVRCIAEYLRRRHPTLQLVGRNGMHKYNNQDHAMMTGLLAARNIMAGQPTHDLWRVNQDAEYHETVQGSGATSGVRGVPRQRSTAEP